ncbi:MAG: hypothetical protein OXG15_12515 [Gammaproteobacteria bacterium]|nr:hypothetical protein [Gammaproteobacteria bacterium]
MTRRVTGELARIANEAGRAKGKKRKVKSLLTPNVENEMSIARIDGLECDEILNLAIEFMAQSDSPQKVHGWFEFSAEAVEDADLTIDYDENPPRHANVIDWPDKDEAQSRATQILYRACYRKAHFNPPIDPTNPTIPDDPCSYVEEIDYRAIPKN